MRPVYSMTPPATIVLDEQDADRILRILYNGTRPSRVHTLICLCGQLADLRESPGAWNGWQILPHALCPLCLAEGKANGIEELYPSQAYEQFLKVLEEILLRTARSRGGE